MAAFEYRALDQEREVRGLVQADTARQARAQLRERGLLPLSVDPVASRSGRGSARYGRERALILRQMAALLNAGLPLDEVLALSADPAGARRAGRALATIRARVLEGHALSDAMVEHPGLFPLMYQRSVAAGEQAGQLDQVMHRLADHAEQQLALARGLIVALVYPLLLALISLAVVWGLLAFVVPRVVGVFEHARQQLPWITRSLLELSRLLSEQGGWLLLALTLLAAALAAALRTESLRARIDRRLLGLPLIGRLLRSRASALFSRTLAILVSSAVPAVDALRAAAEVSSNRKVRADLMAAADRVREGASISAALEPLEWLPSLTLRLIRGGEHAGELGDMLEHAAALQEADLADAGQVLLAVLQPLLILLVGLVVLYIVLAILLPIMNLSQLLG